MEDQSTTLEGIHSDSNLPRESTQKEEEEEKKSMRKKKAPQANEQ